MVFHIVAKPAERPALTRDTSTLALARSPSRRQAAPADSTVAPRKKPTPAAPAAPEPKPKLAARAPARQDSAARAESTGTTDSSGRSLSEAPATDKSNVYSAADQTALDCKESDRATGDFTK